MFDIEALWKSFWDLVVEVTVGKYALISFLILGVLIIFMRIIAGKTGRLAGEWESKFQSGNDKHKETIHSRQYVRFVEGNSDLEWTEKKEVRRYRFVGWFSKEIFRALYWCRDPRITDCGAFVLKYHGHNGPFLKGKYIGLVRSGDGEARLESVDDYEWRRLLHG